MPSRRAAQPIRFTDNILGIDQAWPDGGGSQRTWASLRLEDPKRTMAPEITNARTCRCSTRLRGDGKPETPAAVKPTGPNEPPRSDQPSTRPANGAPAGRNRRGSVDRERAQRRCDGNSSGWSGCAGRYRHRLVKPVGPTETTLPAVEKPAEAPDQVNDIRPGTGQQADRRQPPRRRKPKANLDEESSSKKKKKKGLGKLNPF